MNLAGRVQRRNQIKIAMKMFAKLIAISITAISLVGIASAAPLLLHPGRVDDPSGGWLVGLLPLGLALGLLNIIPYLGSIVGLGIALMAARETTGLHIVPVEVRVPYPRPDQVDLSDEAPRDCGIPVAVGAYGLDPHRPVAFHHGRRIGGAAGE